MPTPRTARRTLGAGRDIPLARLGLRSLRDLVDYPPVQSARVLSALATGRISRPAITDLVKDDYRNRDAAEALAWPISALLEVDVAATRAFAQIGVRSIGDLAQLASEVDATVLAGIQDNGFQERPSAPAELLPTTIGSIASNVRFTSFIRDVELRGVSFNVNPDCLVPLPLFKIAKGAEGSLAEVFLTQKCPVLHLGYLCGHRQSWINLGTHLGEVVHSVSLAPGESRNIALVNWRRRQLTALEERTTTSEQLTATFVQNRALKEITSAVAREHQAGRTQTESNTDVTAASFVAAGGVVGGVAGGVGGAVVGGLSGLAVDVLLVGSDAGAGTIIGSLAGGAAGAAIGGAAGMAAGGLVHSGAQLLGMIEADTSGDRSIVADVHQRIALSTSQTASAVRSLWSTIVVEDAQAEGVDVQTSNITNYNHMHALNIEYYEVLQHYLSRLELERVQPLMYLPFTFFDFTGFRFVRDYWDVIRPHISDDALCAQGDSYFVTENTPTEPDLLPEPPAPTLPGEAESPRITSLVIDVIFKAGDGFVGVLLNWVSDIDLEVLKGQTSLLPTPVDGTIIDQSTLNADEKGKRFTFSASITEAEAISAVRLVRAQLFNTEVRYRVRVHTGTLRQGETTLENLSGKNIVTSGKIAADSQSLTFDHYWSPAGAVSLENAQAIAQYNLAVHERNAVLAENARRLAAFDTLVRDLERFRQRLQRLILRRRHFFTRVILSAIEPEEITQILEALRLGHEDEPNSPGIPLSLIAHTIPLALTSGGFVLKLKRLDKERLRRLASSALADAAVKRLLPLLEYADATLTHFETVQQKDGLARTDHVYVPTGGLFAEAILGRANSAEYLDIERYFNWNDATIPHQAPPVQPVGTESRFQQGDVSVTVPEGNLQVINPVNLPDPTGLSGVLAAIQNGNLFRDMSKSSDLAGMVSSLTTLAGQMGQAASTMTGQAAQQALQSAAEVSKAAATMAQSLLDDAFNQAGSAFNTMSSQGAALNQAAKIDEAAKANSTPGNGTPGAGTPNPGSNPAGNTSSPSLLEETFKKLTGLNGGVQNISTDGAFNAPDLSVPGDQVSPFNWRDLIEFQVPQDILDSLAARNMSSLTLSAASSASVNLDYFPIHVTKLPTVDGQQLTAPQFLQFIRKNLHTNLLIATSLGQFSPYAQADQQTWFSDNPYGAALRIDLLGPDNAAVVCAESADDHWIFHTISTPDTGAHPVSGQRMFGFWSPSPGEFAFYTRGADRATGFLDSLASEQIFGGGAAIWATFQAGVAGFVNSHGGEATVPRAFSGRFAWFPLINILRANSTSL